MTAQEALQSFLREKAAAFGEANAHLTPVHKKYFGRPLLRRAGDFLLRDTVQQAFDEVRESEGSATIVTREHFKTADLRMRYHLAAVGGAWKIVRIDRECLCCQLKGHVRGVDCPVCGGEGWYDPRGKNRKKGNG